jgi:hypothetical protein
MFSVWPLVYRWSAINSLIFPVKLLPKLRDKLQTAIRYDYVYQTVITPYTVNVDPCSVFCIRILLTGYRDQSLTKAADKYN